MSEYKFICEGCGKPYDMESRDTICGLSVCEDCKKTLTSVMSYINPNDINESERKILQKFLNKLIKFDLKNRINIV